MNHDQNKKTLRQFQCRDYLWEIFEQMSSELECSVDYLINEAMRQYARSRNYGVRTPGPSAGPMPAMGGQPNIPSAPPPPPAHGGGYGGGGGGYGSPGYPAPPNQPPRPMPPAYGGGAPAGYPAPQPPAPQQRPSSYPPPPTQRPPAYGSAPQPQAPPYQPPPQGFGGPPQHAPPPLPSSPGMMQGGLTPMWVIFNGQKFPVAKEEFIIGRGTKTADLPIKDGNISRRHAAVIWQSGAWYMKDLGSTNGVEFHGRKIDSKRIEEGDVYQLCDYEIRFTFR